ncbi:MAG: hypothetical protein A2Z18_06340 [Armatimonadetes bacterium RBG_16_58_9]|nr:MAG: hypothetical protein A2Z18_06340 [Armatimonadetes bacterium RBG_16_58_9]
MRGTFANRKLVLILPLAVIGLAALAFVWSLRGVSNDPSPRRVLIEKGASARQIAAILDDKGIIRSEFVFVTMCRIKGVGGKLKPGLYEFNRAMGASRIIKSLEDGDSLETWVTIPEGYTVRQIADLLDAKGLRRREAFLNASLARSGRFDRCAFLYADSLEGYLFPDTYLIARDGDVDGAVTKMLDAFEEKVVSPLRPRLERVILQRFGLASASFAEGLHKMLTMASLVEREAKTDKDRPLIAAVLWNRLEKGMKLQVDATITYVPGESTRNKDRVYHKDLADGSSYNTYRHYGLPPGPICNPGNKAIEAVIAPAHSDCLYYVAEENGGHIFSRTYEQHQAAIRRIKEAARKGGK